MALPAAPSTHTGNHGSHGRAAATAGHLVDVGCRSLQPSRQNVSPCALRVTSVVAARGKSSACVCRAAAAAPLATAARREPVAISPSSAACTYDVDSDWLAHSRRLSGLQLSPQDAVVQHLRRMLGWGGRWAWQEEESGEAKEDVAEEGSAPADALQPADAVVSSIGAGRRGSQRRRLCRGQSLAGAARYGGSSTQLWKRPGNPLPAQLQACAAGTLLTAQQEALLGEMVQAAKVAHQQQEQQRQRGGKARMEYAQRELLLRRGAAAQQLLFDLNLPLIFVAQSKLHNWAQMPAGLLQELNTAGREALWRAAAGYQPSVHTRFSTYAVAAIQNAMRDVLFAAPFKAAKVSRTAHSLSKKASQQCFGSTVKAAIVSLQSEDVGSGQTHDAEPAVIAAQQSSKKQQAGRLAELAAAAQLSQRHVLHGIAAGRPQRLVSPSCWVPVALAEGAAMRSHVQQLIPFEDLQEVDEEESCEAAAEEAVQLVLTRMRPSKLARTLRLRFGLDAAGDSSSGKGGCQQGELLDFSAVGQQMGVSRQRAQQLYHTAISSARSTAAAVGLV
ncbi:hypothetical protein ACK3TF_001543 [Chlorella vulgaris]